MTTAAMTTDEYRVYARTGQLPPHILALPTAAKRLAEKPLGNSPKQPGKRPQPTPGVMNKTETLYAIELEFRRLDGEISAWLFEPMSLKLAKNTHYKPDFLVVLPTGAIEIHEVKGRWEDDARAKTKIAAEKFWMFRFVAVRRRKGEWKFEEFSSSHGPNGPQLKG
jgi:hypothetical protein